MSYDLSAAKAYGTALFQAAKDQGVVDSVWTDARELKKAEEDAPRFILLLQAPHVLRERKVQLASKILGQVQPLLRDFVLLLIAKDRVEVFDDAINHFHDLAEKDQGISHGYVTSATTLDDEQRQRLHAELQATTGLTLTIDYDVDDSLVGGLVFQCGDILIDNSLRSSIQELGEKLMTVRVI